MCCRACSGYDLCLAKGKLTDDCCPQCRYFDSCMEDPQEEEEKTHTPAPRRRRTR